MSNYNERKQWFIDRIGKRVYRNQTSCNCIPCKNVYQNGLIILDKSHAEYLCDVEAEYNAEGFEMNYTDTKQ